MEQKDFQDYFASDYKGIDSLLNDILLPVFGNDFDEGYDTLTDDPVIKEKASYANIDSIRHAGDIHSLGFDIKVYDVTLCDNCKIERSRQGIQSVIRQFINRFESAFMVFHYQKTKGRLWRLSYVEKLATAKESTSAKRYTYICGAGSPCRTIAERFHRLQSVDKTAKALLDAFSVESLSDEFFAKYKAIYANFVQYITGKRVVKVGGAWEEKPIHEPNSKIYDAFDQDDKRIRDYIKKTMGRVTFLYFLQRKGWLNGDPCFMQKLFADSKYQDDFLDRVLEPLFYTILNTDKPDRKTVFLKHNKEMDGTKEVEWDIDLLEGWEGIPFLNGGLFERDENDIVRTQFPKEFFHNGNSADNFINSIPVADYDWKMVPGLLDFFDQYNFTIDENDPDDAEVGVDPEMLGKVFENLLEDNKDKGAFYTPKEIVQYMCRESLIAYLQTDVADDGTKQQLRIFVENPFESTLSAELAKSTLEKIQNVKICDPAIGSGAFPMGLLNLLVACTESLNAICGVKQERIDTKKHIIQNSIYGVDIERGAIDIARLRFWLSIVVDSTGPEPLPNFDYKFMQGNSLLEQFEGVDLSNLMSDADSGSSQLALSFGEADTKKNIKALMNSYFNEKDHTRKAQLRDQIDMQVKEHVRLLTEGRADIAQHLQDIPVSANQHFFLWHTWFNDVFKNGGFDIVIGNPPYVRIQTLNATSASLVKEYNTIYYNIVKGNYDLYLLFIYLGYNLLNRNGVLSYINPNKMFMTDTGTKLRNKIKTDKSLFKLVDFTTNQVFENAVTYTCILFLSKRPNETFLLRRYKLGEIWDLQNITYDIYNTDELPIDTNWTFTQNVNDVIINKIKTIGNKFEQITTKIFKGSSTGNDKIFLLESIEDRGNYLLVNSEINCSPFVIEKDICRKFLYGENVHRYDISNSKKWLLFPYKKTNGKYNLMSIEDLQNNYPLAFCYLSKYKETLLTRKSPLSLDNFYKYSASRSLNDYEQSKILIPDMLVTNRIAYDSGGEFFTGPAIHCPIFDQLNYSYSNKFCLGILNSNVFWFFITNTSTALRGNAYRLTPEFLKDFAFPNISMEIQQPIITLVDRILSAKKENPQADTSKEEAEIDKLVYELYGLTEEEIAIVEGKE